MDITGVELTDQKKKSSIHCNMYESIRTHFFRFFVVETYINLQVIFWNKWIEIALKY